MNKEQQLAALQGKWRNQDAKNEVIEFKGENSRNLLDENDQWFPLGWRQDLNKWVITGLSPLILTIDGNILEMEPAPNQIAHGKSVYDRVI